MKRHLLTEMDEKNRKEDLDELVHKAGKFMKLPSIHRSTLEKVRTSPLRSKAFGNRLSKLKKIDKQELSFSAKSPKAQKRKVFYI